MKVIVRIQEDDEARALAILLRHSQGAMLPGGTYVVSEEAVRALRREGINFLEVSREGTASAAEGAVAGERV